MPSPPRRIQLVLQGGGAKIYALIAAVEAVDDAVKAGKLAVTRIAGTSAGAIVGALYAAGIAPQTMRQAFAAVDLSRVLRLPWWATQGMSSGILARRALKGEPAASDEPLRTLLHTLLKQADLPNDPSLEELTNGPRTPVVLVASNVSTRRPEIYDSQVNKSKSAVAAVLDSCALPFFFRTATRSSQELILDGGLCENLPVSVLTGGVASFGEIVAVCFKDPAGVTPTTGVSLGLALLDTAMSASVAKAKALGNTTLIELDPYDVSTFDFERAQKILAGKENAPYDNARHRAAEVLKELSGSPGKLLSTNRWEVADPATMDQLWTLYNAQQSHRLVKYFHRVMTIEANSLLGEGEEDYGMRDVLVQTVEFAPTKWPIDSLISGVYVEPGQKPSNVFCEVSDSNKKPVIFLPLPAKPAKEPDTYGLLIEFMPPLEPAGGAVRYTVRTEFRMDRVFPHLLEARGGRFFDSARTRILRADGTADRVEIVLHLPKSLGPVAIRNEREGTVQATMMSDEERSDLKHRGYRGHFEVYGWRARDVPDGGRIALEIERTAARG